MTTRILTLMQLRYRTFISPQVFSCGPGLFFFFNFILFLNFTILEGGGRRVQDGEHRYTCGRFISIFGKTNFIFLPHSCTVFPAPLIEIIFSSLCFIASFAKGKFPIGVWVYLWVFHLVSLVCISVFVPVSYCPDDCSFVL